MKTFAIFVTIVTVIYGIYLLLMIRRDRKRDKRKEVTRERTTEEVFGFKQKRVFEKTSSNMNTEDAHKHTIIFEDDDETLLEQESHETEEASKDIEALQASIKPVEPVYEEEYDSDTFTQLLSQTIRQKPEKIIRRITWEENTK